MSNQYGICKCGTDLDMHYEIYCPRCFDNTPELIKSFDLIKTLKKVEVLNGWTETEAQEFWLYITEHDLKGNDTYMRYRIYPTKKAEKILYSSKMQQQFEIYLISLGIEESEDIAFWVSW